ncbi:MAG: peptide chain release factor N(5)-glutamine methyltransferase [Malacoplasma sp.]|nr:peptide chain release factor N(5)-glutamine methyltransferase [Malacoplasma sp.]
MTFEKLLKTLNPLNDGYTKGVLKELILFNSKIIKNSSDIFFEKDSEIDFDYQKINKQLNKVLIKNIPVAYITHSYSFFGLDFYINKGVFIPRQETEFILDWVLNQKHLQDKKYILDLCSGSGVLANTIAYIKQKKDVAVIGVEKYLKPYLVAKKNQKRLQLKTKFIHCDMFKLNKTHYQKCDFIICNPPYIAYGDKFVDDSTKKEPKNALYSGVKGTEFYERFLVEIYPILSDGVKIVFEIGFNQKEMLETFLNKNNFRNYSFLKDMNQNYRILFMEKTNGSAK